MLNIHKYHQPMRMAQRAIQQHDQYQIHEDVVDQVFKLSRAKAPI